MKKKYQVFISSTYKDLIEERLAVTKCLLENNCIPVGMEQFPASNMEQMEYIKQMLDDCDYYILILAGKYGSLDTDGIGYTKKEFDYAISIDLPVICFLIEDMNSLPLGKSETDPKMQKKLMEFRQKASSGRLVNFYSNKDNLTTHVATSINHCIRDYPRTGWVRLTEEEHLKLATDDDDFEHKMDDYMERHTMTKEDIDGILADTFNSNQTAENGPDGLAESFDSIETIEGKTDSKDEEVPLMRRLSMQMTFNSSPVKTRHVYANENKRDTFSFDYSNNNGEFTIGANDYQFTTKWSKASNERIYAYSDASDIDCIARIKKPCKLLDALNGEHDFSSGSRNPEIGDIILWKNKNGKFAATKIVSISDDTRGADRDNLTCEYIIFE